MKESAQHPRKQTVLNHSSPVAASRGETSRRALLLAGAEIFGEKGLEAATTREIAAQAGQNIAAIAYYFGSKEGLYRAIAQEIALEMSARLQSVLDDIDAATERTPQFDPHLLRRLVLQLVRSILSNQGPIAQFILREQQQPTAVFDILYEGTMGRLHNSLNRLFARVLGCAPCDRQAIIRSHALLGQIVIFQTARELILRRTGWTDLGESEIQQIEEGILANVGGICSASPEALASSRRRSSKPGAQKLPKQIRVVADGRERRVSLFPAPR